MKVLVACEYSGRVRDAFIRRGHDAMSCDLLPTDQPGPHYQGDVVDILDDGWDLMVAHPPCTYLANSGVRWLYQKDGTRNEERWINMYQATEFFYLLLNAPIPRIAVENPVMHKHAVENIGTKQTQCIQPWQFGHPESKMTCLWLKNLAPLVPTNNVKAEMDKLSKAEQQRLHWLPPSPDRWKLRSTTYLGIAEAMASQWSMNDNPTLL